MGMIREEMIGVLIGEIKENLIRRLIEMIMERLKKFSLPRVLPLRLGTGGLTFTNSLLK
ncbi:MAG: hypothetical protein ABIL00_02410 [candidate division WOR-3 bacterium]